MTKAFKNWFVGFVDGEGCFYMREKQRGKPTIYPQFWFAIGQREKYIIYKIKKELGFGRINSGRNKDEGITYYFRTSNKDDTRKIIKFFTKNKLRTKKKSNQFLKWKKKFLNING